MKLFTILGLLLLVLIAAGAGVLIAAGMGTFGQHEGPGELTPLPIPRDVVAERASAQRAAAAARGADAEGQILFGDLHVHTTFSVDAFLLSLPALGGRGRAPAGRRLRLRALLLGARLLVDQRPRREPDARPLARDDGRRSGSATPWPGDPANPDVVAFLGWEWTQVGATPENHYGHKNVVLARHRRREHPGAADRRRAALRTAR